MTDDILQGNNQPDLGGVDAPVAVDDGLISLELDGATYRVPPAVAKAFRPVTPAPVAQPAVQPAAPDDFDTIWYTNPREAARRVREETARDLQMQYKVTRFWEVFEDEYPEIPLAYAQGAINVHSDKLDPNSARKAAKQFGKLIKADLAQITGKLTPAPADAADAPSRPAMIAEGGGRVTPRAKAVSAEDEDRPYTLSDAIAGRRRARIQGLQSKPAASKQRTV